MPYRACRSTASVYASKFVLASRIGEAERLLEVEIGGEAGLDDFWACGVGKDSVFDGRTVEVIGEFVSP